MVNLVFLRPSFFLRVVFVILLLMLIASLGQKVYFYYDNKGLVMPSNPVIEVYSKSHCPYCVKAKGLLEQKNLQYQLIDLDANPDRIPEMMERSGRRTVPQIFINNIHVGGCDDLFALETQGQLDTMLRQS